MKILWRKMFATSAVLSLLVSTNAALALATDTTKALKIIDVRPGGEIIQITVDKEQSGIQKDEVFFAQCEPVGLEVTNFRQAEDQSSLLTVKNLIPETEYKCFAAIKSANGEMRNKTEKIDTATGKTIKNVDMLGYTAHPTAIEISALEVENKAKDEMYYAFCEKDEKFVGGKKSYFKDGITINGLKPETHYDCGVGLIRGEKVYKKSSLQNIRTSIADPKSVEIVEAKESKTAIEFSLKSEALKPNHEFVVDCYDPSLRIKKATNTVKKVEIDGLVPGVEYRCRAGALNVPTRAVDHYGEFRFFTTKSDQPTEKAEVKTDKEKQPKNAPYAKFNDGIFANWSEHKNPFPDTDLNKIAGMAAAELNRRKVLQGYEDGSFGGNRDVNRAEAAKFLLVSRYETVEDKKRNNPFKDLDDSQWYMKYVLRANELGIIEGYKIDQTFRPQKTVNRAEFVKMMVETFDLETELPVTFSDVKTSDWFHKYVGAAEKYNLFVDVQADKPELQPGRFMTRNEVAIAIYQYLKNR